MPGSFTQAFGGPPTAKREVILNEKALTQLKRLPHAVAVSPQVRLGGGSLRLNRLMTLASVVGIDPSQVKKLLKVARGFAPG